MVKLCQAMVKLCQAMVKLCQAMVKLCQAMVKRSQAWSSPVKQFGRKKRLFIFATNERSECHCGCCSNSPKSYEGGLCATVTAQIQTLGTAKFAN
jgi:hypothetical protein